MTKSIDVNEYINNFPKDVRNILQEIRDLIQKTAPKATETISYGIPTFDLNKKHLVHFAGFNTYIGFYPTPSGITAFKKELSEYQWAKGSVQFPLDKPIPFDLIQKIVIFRVKEITK